MGGIYGRPTDKSLFCDNISYFNNAGQAILSEKVKNVGKSCVDCDFFDASDDQAAIRRLFASLIHQLACNIAIMPSTSYCLSWCAHNLQRTRPEGGQILLLRDQFASVVYPMQDLCDATKNKFQLLIVERRAGQTWTKSVLEAVEAHGDAIAAAILPPLHWSDGSLLELHTIGTACVDKNIPLMVDGTQAVGILPLPREIPGLTVLACSVHKWLRCASGASLVYVAPTLHNVWEPLESHARQRSLPAGWEALPDSMDDQGHYPNQYWKDVRHFDAGSKPDPIHLPMMRCALEEVAKVDPEQAQMHFRKLLWPVLAWARAHGFDEIDESHQAYHLVGIRHPYLSTNEMLACVKQLAAQNIYIAVRCGAYRISPYLDTTVEDVSRLVEALDTFHRPIFTLVKGL